MKKKKELSYKTSQRGELLFDLNHRKFSFSHFDFDGSNFDIPFTISHVYQNGRSDKGYGKGFRFNLEQTLTKREGTSKYKWVLADGSEEIFEEVYYYKNNEGKRVYQTDDGQPFQRKDITVTDNGTLKYNDHLIEVDLKTDTGWTLKSDYHDFIHSEKLNFKNEEIYQLEQEIKQYNETIEDLQYQLHEYKKFENDVYKALVEAQEDYQKCSDDLKKYQFNSIDLEKKYELLTVKDEYYYRIHKDIYKVGGLSNKKPSESNGNYIECYDELPRLSYKDINGQLAEKYAFISKYYDNRNFDNMSENAKLADYYKQVFTDEVDRLSQKIQELSFKIEQLDLDYQDQLLIKQKDLTTKESDYLSLQQEYNKQQQELLKKYYDTLIKRTEDQIINCNLLIDQKNFQLNQLKQQLPECFLYHNDGVFYGFNQAGNLCMLLDAYEHQVQIQYNEQDQIQEIVDGNQHKIEFIYNVLHQLIRMVDEKEQYIDFKYDGEFLMSFCYSDKDCFSLNYRDEILCEVIDIDSVGYRLEYQNDLVSKLQYYSSIKSFVEEELQFHYLVDQIQIETNKNDLKQCFLFDHDQSLTTEYVLKNNALENIKIYEYSGNHCSFSMKSSKLDPKLLEVSELQLQGVQSYPVTLLNNYTSDYILYAFAEANSLTTCRQRRVTAYCEHVENASEIAFELRCRLNYNGYYKEYSVSFNPDIKGKQLAAIPVTLDEDSDGQVIIPNEILVYTDYSGNSGICKISNLTLTQGEYQYCEYNEAHHKILECSSEVSAIQTRCFQKEKTTIQKEEITYEYNPKELLEKETHSITTQVYDSNNTVIFNDFDKLLIYYTYNKQNKLIRRHDSTGFVEEIVYNNQGSCIQKRNYHETLPEAVYMEETLYDEDGKVLQEKNELGNPSIYHYEHQTLAFTETPNGHVLYAHTGDSASAIYTDVDGIGNSNTNIYEHGRLTAYQTDGMSYRYVYDDFGREKELYINDQLYCKFDRVVDSERIYYSTLYHDQSGYEKECDLYDKVLSISKIVNGNKRPYIVYEYDDRDRLSKEHHYLNDQEEVMEYCYVEDTLVGLKTKDYTKRIDQELYTTNTVYQMHENEYAYLTTYDKYGKVLSSQYSKNDQDVIKEVYRYDPLNRIKEVSRPLIKEHYTYLSTNARTTNLISVLKKKIGTHYQNNHYSYDKEGNITSKKENQQTTRYTYDSLNRLVREDNEAFHQTILYTYDGNGNIQTKEYCDYTQTDSLVKQRNIEYNYSDFNDYLTEVDGQKIAYDCLGNPIVYKDIPLIWNQKELKKYDDIEFSYNIHHIRTKKITPTEVVEYILDGSKILKEKRRYYTTHLESYIDENATIDSYEEELEYLYSNQGIIGFDFIKGNQRKRYYYNKNILGDILEIYDEDGKLVAKYNYDAYGNHEIINNTEEHIGDINPIRYRSYYYDIETKLYYLNSRYYDPEVCRFISMDSIEYLDPETIGGLNLYSYCLNNPVKYYDLEGHWAMPNWLKWLIGGVVIVGLGIAMIATGGAAAGVAGFIVAGAFKGAVIGAISGALVSGIIGGISSAISGNGFWSGFADGAANGFMSGAIIGGITGAISSGVQVANAAKSWVSAGGKTSFKQMTEHYTKHVINEGQKSVAKNIVNYTKQAKAFFANNNTSGHLLREGVIKISGAPGGIFNTSGLIRSFWYVLL